MNFSQTNPNHQKAFKQSPKIFSSLFSKLNERPLRKRNFRRSLNNRVPNEGLNSTLNNFRNKNNNSLLFKINHKVNLGYYKEWLLYKK